MCVSILKQNFKYLFLFCFVCSFGCLVGLLLVGWLVDWLVGWLVGWLAVAYNTEYLVTHTWRHKGPPELNYIWYVVIRTVNKIIIFVFTSRRTIFRYISSAILNDVILPTNAVKIAVSYGKFVETHTSLSSSLYLVTMPLAGTVMRPAHGGSIIGAYCRHMAT